MIILVEDKQGDVKQQFFYDCVPAGGKIRVFGSAAKFDENPKSCPAKRRKRRSPISSTTTWSNWRPTRPITTLPAQLGIHRKGRAGPRRRVDQRVRSTAEEVRRIRPSHGLFRRLLLPQRIHCRGGPGLGRRLQLRREGEGDAALAGSGARARRLHLDRPAGGSSQGHPSSPLGRFSEILSRSEAPEIELC